MIYINELPESFLILGPAVVWYEIMSSDVPLLVMNID